jgi:hypothetical protein
VLGIFQNLRESPTDAADPLRNHHTLLQQKTTDLIRLRCALGHRLAARSVQMLEVLLLNPLDGHKPHVGAAHRLTDRFGV